MPRSLARTFLEDNRTQRFHSLPGFWIKCSTKKHSVQGCRTNTVIPRPILMAQFLIFSCFFALSNYAETIYLRKITKGIETIY